MIDHFSFIAPLYDRLIGPPERDRLRQLLRLPVEGALLDAGGGTGRVSTVLRPLVGQLVINDESTAMLHQARAKALCCPVAATVERLPFADGTFARVLVVDALHHFADQRQAIRELVRVLQPGGRLVIEEPDLRRLLVKGIALAEKLMLMRSHFYYPHEIGHMVAECGLQPHVESDGKFATWIIADKQER